MFTLDRISPALFATSPADFEVIEYRIEADYIEEYLAISKNEKKVIVKDEGKSQAKSQEQSSPGKTENPSPARTPTTRHLSSDS